MTPLTFQDRLKNAEAYLQEDRLQDSISEYTIALDQATNREQLIDLHKVLGRLYQRSEKPSEAISAFEAALGLYQSNQKKEARSDIASVHNNLAALYLASDISRAMMHYQKALEIYEAAAKEEGSKYQSHLANTHFALAEAFVQNANPIKAKSHFKAALRIYDDLPELADLRARAHYQLGLIYTDEFNLHDAQLQYAKALKVYESLPDSEGRSAMALRAALHNNLAVTYNSMQEREKAVASYRNSLDLYRELAVTHADIFLPYEAATLNSLGIVYSEMQETRKAIDVMQQCISLYHRLADSHPEQYTHYLATSLHNQGLLYFEVKELGKAEHFFREALALRRKVMMEERELFAPDTCATALNLVELYQLYLESTLDTSYKAKSLELLKEVSDLLDSLEDDRLVLKNMRADCASHLEYFSTIDLEDLTVRFVRSRASVLREEMNGTIEPSEKLICQEELTHTLHEKYQQFEGNEELRINLAHAYNDLAWLLLRLGRTREARRQIEKGLQLDPDLNLLLCNKAHCEFLDHRPDRALALYSDFLGSEPGNMKSLKEILSKDLEVLQKDGIADNGLEEVRKNLSL